MRLLFCLITVLTLSAAQASANPLQASSPALQSPSPAQPPYGPDNPRPGSARADMRHLMQEHPGEPMPDNRSVLDTALAQDPGSVLKLLEAQSDPKQVYLDLNWERARIYDGAGLAVSMAYMVDLWRVAPTIGPMTNGDTVDGLRQTAVAFALYNLSVISLDGTRCADPSAPAHRVDQLIQYAAPIFKYGHGLPDAEKQTAVTVAINVERATAPARKDDPVLCSGGMAEIQQGLAANGDKQLPKSPEPGYVGPVVKVPDAPGYRPTYLAPEVWQPVQQKLRAGLPTTLRAVIGLPESPAN